MKLPVYTETVSGTFSNVLICIQPPLLAFIAWKECPIAENNQQLLTLQF